VAAESAWLAPRARGTSEVVFYDGHCGLCHGFVRFLLRVDRTRAFTFAPLQGETFTAAVPEAMRRELPDSIVVRTVDGRILVKSTAIRHSIANDYVVTADVTIRDVTRPVDFDVVFLGFYKGMDGSRRAGFSARAKVNRKDWGLNWNVALEAGGWLVGDEITLDVEIAVQQATAAGEASAAA